MFYIRWECWYAGVDDSTATWTCPTPAPASTCVTSDDSDDSDDSDEA